MRLLAIAALLSIGAISRADEKAKPFDMFNDIEPSALKVDVPSRIRVRSKDDARRVRKELISFIWRNDGRFPSRTDVDRAAAELPKPLAGCDAKAETLIVAMDNGFKSVVYFLLPKKSNNRLAIFHQGHGDVWTGGAVETTKFLVDRGFAVLVFQMPLFGDNKPFAPAGIRTHNDMAKLASPTLEPIRFFVEPIAVALNHSLKTHAYDDVTMIGLSGGGWTTTLYAAIDPRVHFSFPVAGSLPDFLRVGHHAARDRGDWEQSYPALYKIANYLDLYVLGATGPGRRQRQVLNKYDSCCFAGVGFRTYEKHVSKAAAALGGAFDVYLDESHREHLVSKEALQKAIDVVLKR